MFETFKILDHQGKQFIPVLDNAKTPSVFRGRAEISDAPCPEGCTACVDLCPTDAIQLNPLRLDHGFCVNCNECAASCPADKFKFTNDHKFATNVRERLIVYEGKSTPIRIDQSQIRKEIQSVFGRSFKLRQVSAAGDNSTEMELNAGDNVNFDMSRYGIEWVASPRHADAIVISGPISQNMAEALEIAYQATPDPKVVILAGVDAISGGIFAGSPALDRSFLDRHKVDLYIPGNPIHPLTLVLGLLELTGRLKRND
ncbi:MAG: NADH:ubiquinone oxidoreductase [Bacteroidota bacterium]